MNSREKQEARSIGEQAAQWLLTLEEGKPQDREAFSDWLARSPLHINAFLRAAAMDSLLGRVDLQHTVEIERLAETADAFDIDPAPVSRHQPRSGKRWRWAAAACVMGMLVTFGIWKVISQSATEHAQSFITDVGEQRALELQDGSVLHLNTSSRVTIRFTPQERRVDLLAGEALFRVHRDSSRPFRVHSGPAVVEALGTQFNIHRRQEDAVVSVLEGAVKISNTASRPALRLDAGEEARVESNGKLSEKVVADASRVSAWRQRRLIFKDEPLSDIAAEFNRYNRTPKIRVADELIGKRRYAAAFDADDPESLLGILRKDPMLQVEQHAGELLILPRPQARDGPDEPSAK